MKWNFKRPKFGYGLGAVLERDVLRASKSLDFPSIATTASSTLTIDVPGARAGDTAQVYPSTPVAGLVYVAWVSDEDEVTVRATNVTGDDIDASSSVHRVVVMKAS